VYDTLEKMAVPHKGLYPTYINRRSGKPGNYKYSIGGMGDSFYEYNLKAWLLSSKTQPKYKRLYLESISSVYEQLVRGKDSKYLWVATSHQNEMEHLVCFLPGTLMLGLYEGVATGKDKDMHLYFAEKLMDTCLDMYASTESGLAADTVRFNRYNDEIYIKKREFRLRPETVESVFYMWRITKKQKYRDAAWQMFQSMRQHCKVGDGRGYANVLDVNRPSAKEDRMESFWLAETLKYLYLTFEDDDVIPLDEYVFNTEAHPILKIRDRQVLREIETAN